MRACAQHARSTDYQQILDQCKKECDFYRQTGILMISGPHSAHIKKETPSLHAAFQRYDRNKPLKLDPKVLESIDEKWKPNVTMIDLQWLRSQGPFQQEVDVGHNIFQLGCQLQHTTFFHPSLTKDVGRQMEILTLWFWIVADGLKKVRDRIMIEVCHGDVIAVMEQIRYGVVGHRQQSQPALISAVSINGSSESPSQPDGDDKSATAELSIRWTQPAQQNSPSVDTSDYPKLYDRIHLSNVPDYVGGQLTSFLYALPLLYPGKSSFLTSNCLFNPPLFKTIAHFNNEYLCLSSPADLEKMFGTRRIPFDTPGETVLELAEYYRWYRQEEKKDVSGLMARPPLEAWLYRLLFKLCLPKDRPIQTVMIYSPLNMTIFIRLCVHLHSIGHPAHWISGVLYSLISGTLTNKARPPRSDPLKIREVKTEMPAMKQSTAPFATKLSTLISMWQCVFPFGLITPNLPQLDQIRRYEIVIDEIDVDYGAADLKTFAIVLLNTCI